MFCLNCGKELDNNAKFCPHCGAVVGGNAPQYTPPQYPATQYIPTQYSQGAGPAYVPSGNPGTPNAAPNPRRAGLGALGKVLIGAGAVVLVAVLAVVIVVSGIFAGDKGKVSRAAAKSISAFAGAARNAGLPDLNGLIEKQAYSQSGEIALERIEPGRYGGYYDYDVFAIEGAGMRFSTNYDLSGEKLSASVTPFYGSADLLTAQLVMDGSRVYVNLPELTGSTYYGLDTMTLGRDLQDLGADEDVVGDLSFNIFQLAKRMQEITKMDDESLSAIMDAGKKLYDAIEVEKTGVETIRVNSNSVKCDAYTVAIPKQAMKDYLRAVRSAVSSSVDYRRELVELFSSIGLPDGMVDEIEEELSDADLKQSVRDLFNGLEDIVDELGEVELQVYISKGYIMAVTCSERIGGNRVRAELNIGGGKNYVDDLSLRLSVDDYAETELVLTSHGSHGASGGSFTDETVLELTRYGYTAEISSELSYASKKDRDNFSWRIVIDDVRINMEGRLTAGKNSVELHLDELSFREDDMSVSFRVDYSAGPYQGIPSVNSSVMVLTLDEDELRDIAEEISDNAIDWAQDLIDKIPEMENFFGSGDNSNSPSVDYPAP